MTNTMAIKAVNFLASAARTPRWLYVLLALIYSFLNKRLSKENSGSTGPIFTKFSQYDRYLIADYRFDHLLPIA